MPRPPEGEAPAAGSPGPERFEEALERLEAIVDQLEQGDLALEDALSAFEEGVQLSRQCARQLDAAERRIEELTRENGSGDWAVRPFEGGEPEDAPDEEP